MSPLGSFCGQTNPAGGTLTSFVLCARFSRCDTQRDHSFSHEIAGLDLLRVRHLSCPLFILLGGT